MSALPQPTNRKPSHRNSLTAVGTRLPRRLLLPKMAWQKSVMERCPDCGGRDVAVWQENPHCFDCGGELIFARENERYSAVDRCCSKCGVVDHSFHYIFGCQKCGKEFRVRVDDDGESEWNGGNLLHDHQLVETDRYWETSAPPYLKSSSSYVVCHGCGRVLGVNAIEKNLHCPSCGFVTTVGQYREKVYGEPTQRVGRLDRLLPVSVSVLLSVS